jgi:hypothetical protein
MGHLLLQFMSVAVAVSTSAVLERAKGWLTRYNRPILMVAFAAIGVLYSVKGAAGLLR